MRVLRCVSLLAVCLGLVGCQAFSKKPQGGQNAGNRPSNTAAPARLGQPTTTPRAAATKNNQADAPVAATAFNGILAGQVIDSYNRPPPTTYIQVTAAQEQGDTPGAPISREVEVTNQGYFTIEGLQQGRHYQLVARAKDGDRLLAGRTWATPPNPKVLIRISEDFATKDIPPVPDTPGIRSQTSPPPSWPEVNGKQPGRRNDSAWAPYRDTNPNPNNRPTPHPESSKPADLGKPVPGDGTTQPSQTNVRPDSIADKEVARRDDIKTEMPHGPPPIPSCVLTGRQLHNFALNELNGRPWEYRNHRGRLVLIDFWGSWCIPCLDTVPHLRDLQHRFGGYGLEVVGITYEQNGSWQEQVQRVDRVRQRLRINYQLLMGAGSQCPVQTQFQVSSLPTLVLVDENNQIIWRHEGGLDRPRLNELEAIIKRQLGLR